MSLIQSSQYQVRLFAPNGHGDHWNAVVTELPFIQAQGDTRAEALARVEARLQETIEHSETVTVTVNNESPSIIVEALSENELIETLRARGYTGLGIFKDNPEALELFDEIERQRDALTVGDILKQMEVERTAA
jgi:predicted RNase H-like HicB family nuclease